MIKAIYVNNDARIPYTGINDDVDGLAITFDTDESAEAFAAHFPKYCKVRVSRIWGTDPSLIGGAPHISLNIYTGTRNEVTGARNETAEKRRAKIIEIIEKNELI